MRNLTKGCSGDWSNDSVPERDLIESVRPSESSMNSSGGFGRPRRPEAESAPTSTIGAWRLGNRILDVLMICSIIRWEGTGK